MNLKKKIIFVILIFACLVCYNIIEAGGLSISLNTPISFPVDI